MPPILTRSDDEGNRGVASPQTLSLADRRIVAAWAAECAEHVLPLFEAEAPADVRVRDAIARARAFGRGDLDAHGEIRRRFEAGRAAGAATTPAGAAAARSAAQAASVAHMGAHALGAAAYAAKAIGLAHPDQPRAADEEVLGQLDRVTPQVRDALRLLPLVGENSSGPLGAGLLASGQLRQGDPGDPGGCRPGLTGTPTGRPSAQKCRVRGSGHGQRAWNPALGVLSWVAQSR
ncbi:putative immunity protein [Salana multivorans]